jgi:hypothetical protein
MKVSHIIEAKHHSLLQKVECPHCTGKGWYWYTMQYGEDDVDVSKEPCDLCDMTGEITKQEYLKRGYDKTPEERRRQMYEATHIGNEFGRKLRDLLSSVPTTDFASDDFIVDMSYGQTVKALMNALGEPEWKSPEYGDDEPYWYLSNDRMVVTVDAHMTKRPNAKLVSKVTAEYDPNGMKGIDMLEASHHTHISYTKWVHDAIEEMLDTYEKSKKQPHKELEISRHEANQAIQELTKEFGEPEVFDTHLDKDENETSWRHIHDRWEEDLPFFINVFKGPSSNHLLVDWS